MEGRACWYRPSTNSHAALEERVGKWLGWSVESESVGWFVPVAIVEDSRTGKVMTPRARDVRFPLEGEDCV